MNRPIHLNYEEFVLLKHGGGKADDFLSRFHPCAGTDSELSVVGIQPRPLFIAVIGGTGMVFANVMLEDKLISLST